MCAHNQSVVDSVQYLCAHNQSVVDSVQCVHWIVTGEYGMEDVYCPFLMCVADLCSPLWTPFHLTAGIECWSPFFKFIIY